MTGEENDDSASDVTSQTHNEASLIERQLILDEATFPDQKSFTVAVNSIVNLNHIPTSPKKLFWQKPPIRTAHSEFKSKIAKIPETKTARSKQMIEFKTCNKPSSFYMGRKTRMPFSGTSRSVQNNPSVERPTSVSSFKKVE